MENQEKVIQIEEKQKSFSEEVEELKELMNKSMEMTIRNTVKMEELSKESQKTHKFIMQQLKEINDNITDMRETLRGDE